MLSRYNLRPAPKKTKMLLVEETTSKAYDSYQLSDYNFEEPLLTIEEADTQRTLTFQTPLPHADVHDNLPDTLAYWTLPDDPADHIELPESQPHIELDFEEPEEPEDFHAGFEFTDFLFGPNIIPDDFDEPL